MFDRCHWPLIAVDRCIEEIVVERIVKSLAEWQFVANGAISSLASGLFAVLAVGITRIEARFTISKAEFHIKHVDVHHGCRVLVETVNMIAGIVACTGCLLAIHNKLAAITSISGDECPWVYAHRRDASFICRYNA